MVPVIWSVLEAIAKVAKVDPVQNLAGEEFSRPKLFEVTFSFSVKSNLCLLLEINRDLSKIYPSDFF